MVKCSVKSATLALMFAMTVAVSARGQEHPSGSLAFLDMYERVLDCAFPTGVGDFSGGKFYSMTLRYRPYHSSESQIDITKRLNGNLEVVVYRVPQSAPPIYEQVAALLKSNAKPDVESLCRQIRRERTTYAKLPMRVTTLLTKFSTLNLTLQFDTNIVLDGDVYDYWFDSDSNTVHFHLTAKYRDPSRDYPLIRWMHSVNRAIDNLGQMPR